jgi:putative ABC transport system substrate-binding protein
MRRRQFISLLSGALAWPLAARAQRSAPALPVIGFLSSRGERDSVNVVAAFHDGLKRAGFDESRTVVIEYRWAEGPIRPTAGAGGRSRAPQGFVAGGVRFGLVASLSRPGGNVTGASLITVALGAKRLELLRELVHSARTMAMLINPDTPDSDPESNDVLTAARALGLDIHVIKARSQSELEPAFGEVRQMRAGALMVGADPFFTSRRSQLVALASRYVIPTIYYWREFVEAGGLMSYGTSIADGYRQAGIYAGQILNGAKPAGLPVVQPTKLELVINLKTAKALGLAVPPALLARADEVIE